MRFLVALLAWLAVVSPALAQMALGDLAGSFEGVIPCADCPGIRQRVELGVDGRFRSRMTYLERNAAFDEAGTWAVDNGTLTLTSAGRDIGRWAIQDQNTLTMLDQQGQAIRSTANHTLTRVGAPPSAYATALVGPRWSLQRIGDRAVTPPPNGRRPFLTFDAAGGLAGDAGCNRLTGSYVQTGGALTFGPTAGTRMACADLAMETERRLIETLGRVETWSIDGDTLTLGNDGAPLLVFSRS